MWTNSSMGQEKLQASNKDEVDWGALAQAWIQNKSDEKFSNDANFPPYVWNQSHLQPNYVPSWNVEAAHNQHWFATSPSLLPHPRPPPPPPPPPPCPGNPDIRSHPQELYRSMNHSNAGTNQTGINKIPASISQTFKNPPESQEYLPHNDSFPPSTSWPSNVVVNSCDTQPVQNATKQPLRKVLPAWIREGLEKMGKNNVSKEDESSKKDPTAPAIIEKQTPARTFLGNIPVESEYSDSDGDVPLDGDVPEKLNDVPFIEMQEPDIMEKVKKYLTTILLEVTESEIACISSEVYKHCSKAPAKPLVQSSALSSICNTGLVAGYSSDEESSEEENFYIDHHELDKKIELFHKQQNQRLKIIEAEPSKSTHLVQHMNHDNAQQFNLHHQQDTIKSVNGEPNTDDQITHSADKADYKHPADSKEVLRTDQVTDDKSDKKNKVKRKRKHSKKGHKHNKDLKKMKSDHES